MDTLLKGTGSSNSLYFSLRECYYSLSGMGLFYFNTQYNKIFLPLPFLLGDAPDGSATERPCFMTGSEACHM